MIDRRCVAACAFFVLAAHAGCGSSRLDSFPEFPAHKARIGKSLIVADFIVMQATGSDTAAVDLARNKAAADTILNAVQEQLDAKGYSVSSKLLSSVGILLDSTFTADVSHTSELDREGEDAGLLFHPPFYLYQALRRDHTLADLLESAYRKLAALEDTDGPYAAIPEIVPLGKVFGGGMMFVFLGGGFEVPPGIGAAETSERGAEMGDKIGFQAVSQASLHMYVLDPETGAVLWVDSRTSRGGMVYNEKFLQMAESLLGELP